MANDFPSPSEGSTDEELMEGALEDIAGGCCYGAYFEDGDGEPCQEPTVLKEVRLGRESGLGACSIELSDHEAQFMWTALSRLATPVVPATPQMPQE